MSFNNINTKLRSERGFTIVELLIVIVIIGILAAITIVAYNGVTARANKASAQAAANAAIKKAEAYNAETNAYPTASSNLTTAATTTTYRLDGVTFSATNIATAPSSPNILKFFNCTTGQRVDYWDYAATTPAWTAVVTGGATTANCTTFAA